MVKQDDQNTTRRLLSSAGLRIPRLKRPLTKEESEALIGIGQRLAALTDEMLDVKTGTATREQRASCNARRKQLAAEQARIVARARKPLGEGKD